jgi:hypothetical protein
MVLSRKSYNKFSKGKPYRSFKKRTPNGDIDVRVLAFLLLVGGIIWIIGAIIQLIVTYYYIFIILFVIGMTFYFASLNKTKLETSKFESPSENKNGNIEGEICSNPNEAVPKNNYSAGGYFSPEHYTGESSARLNNPINYEQDSYDYHKNTYKSNLQFESSEKGDKFERYVAERFNDELFSIVEWTTDMSRKHNRFVESDCNPDLVIRDRKTNQIFCVECKYRSRLVNGYFDWSYPSQMDRYFSYARKRNISFYAVLGLGGTPDFPSEIFCIPLEEAKTPQIHISTLQKYHHNGVDFLWAGSRLK